jgi:hypothetical protein
VSVGSNCIVMQDSGLASGIHLTSVDAGMRSLDHELGDQSLFKTVDAQPGSNSPGVKST